MITDHHSNKKFLVSPITSPSGISPRPLSKKPDPINLQSDIGIGNTMDIPKVHRVIKEAVRKVEGVMPDKNVDVWFTGFGDSSMTFRVRWWVETYADKRRVTDSVNATIQEVASRESIDMPNPTYNVDNQLKLSDEDMQRLARTLKELS